jgi:O-antigen/teichoic acid export membrane protein
MVRRVLHAANAIILGNLISRAGGLLLVPLFLRYWSATRYGEYLALFAAAAYLSSLDIGMQGAAVNRLTQAYAREDLVEYRRVQHTALAFFILLALGASILAASVAWFLPVSRWLGLTLTKPATAAAVIVALAIYVMWSMPVQVIVATHQTMGNMARSQWIRNLHQMLLVALTVLALILGAGMKTIALLQMLTLGLVATFMFVEIRRHFPELSPGVRSANLSVFKELAKPSFLFALIMVGNLIAYEGSILLTSALLGGLAVAVLSISKSLTDVIRLGLYSISLALCPDYARMETLGELEKLRRTHRMTVAATAAITLAIVASLWFEGTQFITAWTRGRIEPDPMLLRLFLVLIAFQTSWAASSTVARASNRHRAQAIGYFFAAIVGTSLVAALIKSLGTWAIPLGLTLGEAICCYHFVVQESCHIIGESYSAFAIHFWLGFALVGTGAFSVAWGVHLMPLPMLVRWAAVGSSSVAVAGIVGWMLWLTPEDRALLAPKLYRTFSVSEVNA